MNCPRSSEDPGLGDGTGGTSGTRSFTGCGTFRDLVTKSPGVETDVGKKTEVFDALLHLFIYLKFMLFSLFVDFVESHKSTLKNLNNHFLESN